MNLRRMLKPLGQGDPGFRREKQSPGERDRRAALAVTFALCLAALFFGCAREEIASDQEPPPSPQFVARSADTALIEEGIDAVPGGDYIWVSWMASEAEDLAGYRLYRLAEDSTDDQTPEMIEDLALADLGASATPGFLDNSDLLFTDSSRGFYYWVTAYDESGNESSLSSSAYFRLLKKADLQMPVPVGDTLSLSWNYTGDPFEVDYFVVRLFRLEVGGWTPFWLYQHDVYFPAEVDHVGSLAGGSYRYQVDAVGASPPVMPSGSEASWQFELP